MQMIFYFLGLTRTYFSCRGWSWIANCGM